MSRQGYLPVASTEGIPHASKSSPRLLSRLLRKTKLSIFLVILVLVALPTLVYLRTLTGQGKFHDWQPHEWFSSEQGSSGWLWPWNDPGPPPPPPPPPPKNRPGSLPGPPPSRPQFPPANANAGSASMMPDQAPDSFGPSYSGQTDHLRLGPQAWPPPFVDGYKQQTKSKFIDSNPHHGQLSSLHLQILNLPRKSQRPPKPPVPPSLEGTGYVAKSWSKKLNGSQTTFADSFLAHEQPHYDDGRKDAWQPPMQFLDTNKPASNLNKVQFAFKDPSRRSGSSDDPQREETLAERQRLVKAAFLHAWEGYKRIAWGHDEVGPISEAARDNFNGWGATIVDALDTLLVMDLPDEYDLARQHVRDIDFTFVGGSRSAYSSSDGRIPVFETAIRYLGGFLAAYDLSGDELMRDRAEELAQIIEPAFWTRTGVPLSRVKPSHERPVRGNFASSGHCILAEAGSMLLEFTRLWQVTGDRRYFDLVQRTTDYLETEITASSKLGALLPVVLKPDSNTAFGAFTFGGMADSYYEYLIKEFQLLGGRLKQYADMYSSTIVSAREWLVRDITTVPNTSLVTFGVVDRMHHSLQLSHLACFSGGMLGLGAKLLDARKVDMPLAERFTESCWWAYNSTATGVGPEQTEFLKEGDWDVYRNVSVVKPGSGSHRINVSQLNGNPIIGIRYQQRDYRGRPETIESVLYMWRITGDPVWQERGWQMFCSWVTHSMTNVGFANIQDVTSVPALLIDSMESYVFAETFKYYYLLFSPPDLISLDDYVFTTESHPLLVPKDGKWAAPATGPKPFWDPSRVKNQSAAESEAESYTGGEGELYGGLTNAQKFAVYNQHMKELEEAKAAAEAETAKGMLQDAVTAARDAGEGAIKALVKRMRDLIYQGPENDHAKRSDGGLERLEAEEATLSPSAHQAIQAAIAALQQQGSNDKSGEPISRSTVIQTDDGLLEIRISAGMDGSAAVHAEVVKDHTSEEEGPFPPPAETWDEDLEAIDDSTPPLEAEMDILAALMEDLVSQDGETDVPPTAEVSSDIPPIIYQLESSHLHAAGFRELRKAMAALKPTQEDGEAECINAALKELADAALGPAINAEAILQAQKDREQLDQFAFGAGGGGRMMRAAAARQQDQSSEQTSRDSRAGPPPSGHPSPVLSDALRFETAKPQAHNPEEHFLHFASARLREKEKAREESRRLNEERRRALESKGGEEWRRFLIEEEAREERIRRRRSQDADA